MNGIGTMVNRHKITGAAEDTPPGSGPAEA